MVPKLYSFEEDIRGPDRIDHRVELGHHHRQPLKLRPLGVDVAELSGAVPQLVAHALSRRVQEGHVVEGEEPPAAALGDVPDGVALQGRREVDPVPCSAGQFEWILLWKFVIIDVCSCRNNLSIYL